MHDYQATVISQFSNSPTLGQMIANLNAYIDQSANFDLLYADLWNVLTAVGYGLDVWGRIVQVGRVLALPVPANYLGWAEALPGAMPWTQGIWFGGPPVTANFILSDDAYRQLILAKALANICNGSIPAINQILMYLFPGIGNCYVTDGLNMTMTYTFSSMLNPVQFAIVTESGVLPRPTGVSATVVQL